MMARIIAYFIACAAFSSPCEALTVLIYSRADSEQAEKVRRLLRVSDPVWMDRDLVPGTPWRSEIGRRICRADRVVVVWSAYAAASVEVGAEWRHAAACGRKLVPVLLDGTAMPAELGARQAVDWR